MNIYDEIDALTPQQVTDLVGLVRLVAERGGWGVLVDTDIAICPYEEDARTMFAFARFECVPIEHTSGVCVLAVRLPPALLNMINDGIVRGWSELTN